ncbi:MAG: ABC transporter ATP-binding protein [Eubacteriales bacterium]|nr:ABC transporter ATP-binding protein [Eubacteriales bacterium]
MADHNRLAGKGRLIFEKTEKPKKIKETLLRLEKYFADEWRLLIKLFVIVLMIVICAVYVPKLQSQVIDHITNGEFGKVSGGLATMALVYVVQCICTWMQGCMGAKLSQNIVKQMRKDLFDNMVCLPICYLDKHSHGDLMSRMTNDIENISNTVSQSVSSMFSGIFTIIGTVCMMFYLCPKLAALSCITVIMTVTATKFLSGIMRNFFQKRQELLGSLNGKAEEMINGYKTVIAYNGQEKIEEEFIRITDDLTKVGIYAEIISGAMGPVMNAINNCSFVIIAAFGGYFALKGDISIGIISAFIVYAKQFGRPISELAQVYGQIQTAIAGAERVFEIIDEKAEDKSGSTNMDKSRGILNFEHINFSYNQGKQVLTDFSMQVNEGEKIALVGATGSGKTTVVNLLMRFYEVDSGEILIDGVNIKDISCDELRRNIAIVLQDTVFFEDTIQNNLKYSRENASDAEMIEATKLSHCHNMIKQLPSGYQTYLKGKGDNLSQGQKQLLAIARAFLAQPKILILDEATSNIDTRTEKRIQDAMTQLMKNRTSLIIAHRLSTIQDADCIIVMDQGRIIEKGKHDELIQKHGKYYELYMTQFAGISI